MTNNLELKKASLDYIILLLAKWGIEDGHYKNVEDFNIKNNFDQLKVMLLPYLIVTANGKDTRIKLLENSFDTFVVDKDYGFIEYFVHNYIKENQVNNNFVDYTNFNRISINFNIDENSMDIFETSILNYYKLTEEENIKLKKSFEAIKHSVINVYKEKLNKKLYDFNSDALFSGIKRTSPFLGFIFKKELFNKIIPSNILIESKSVFSEDIDKRILVY